MKAEISCAVLLCLMGCMTGAAASESIAGSIESDPIDFALIFDPIDSYMPAQETPIVLAQAASPGDATQPDYLLKACKQIESTGNPRSAGRAVDPAGMLVIFLQNREHRVINLATEATIKPILLESTTHGKITTEVDNTGLTFYGYDPIPNYIGNDKAVFMAEFEGKRYKIVIKLVVTLTVGETPLLPGEKPVCPPPKLIKVTPPSSGASGSGAGYDLSSVSVTNQWGQTRLI